MGGSPITERSTPITMVSTTPLHMVPTLSPLAESFVKTTSDATTERNHHIDNVKSSAVVAATAVPTVRFYQDHRMSSSLRDFSDKSNDSDDSHQDQHHRRSKSVGFADVEIRAYSVTMGDHPCCTMGCPLSLGWEYSHERNVSIDDYEATRCPRRSREDLKTSWDQRRDLLKNSGVTDHEVKRAERKLHRERSCQRKNRTKICATFFQDVPCPLSPTPSTSDSQQPESRCT